MKTLPGSPLRLTLMTSPVSHSLLEALLLDPLPCRVLVENLTYSVSVRHICECLSPPWRHSLLLSSLLVCYGARWHLIFLLLCWLREQCLSWWLSCYRFHCEGDHFCLVCIVVYCFFSIHTCYYNFLTRSFWKKKN